MKTIERDREQPCAPAASEKEERPDESRANALSALSRGNDIIRRALSGDSQRYLNDVRQAGGQ